jgi:hypothetical protein
MIFSDERMSANNLESFVFIGFLLIFAIAASAYVWIEGRKKDMDKGKLLLDVVLVLTSVVPPELPMELTLAVNASLVALSKFGTFRMRSVLHLRGTSSLGSDRQRVVPRSQPFSAPNLSEFRSQARSMSVVSTRPGLLLGKTSSLRASPASIPKTPRSSSLSPTATRRRSSRLLPPMRSCCSTMGP